MSVNRRLAAIMVADVVGYSRLMEADEAGTLAVLKERRKGVFEPVVKAHGGRIVKVMGDGVLVEFASAVNAVQGAIELQKQMAAANVGVEEGRRIELRIGINLGDVIGEGSDIYGEGVNIAARLEPLAKSGGICVSRGVHEQVAKKIDLAMEDLGEQQLKNISQPIRVYRVAGTLTKPALALPDKPSIAVLPFQNMSGEPEQEYFADGIVEEIITALSRFNALFVIARNSTFTYKSRAVDVKQVGRELGVRYVLEGSVRKAGNKVRIAGQLVDATTGTHLWADRFDGGLEDIFDLQDRVTASVVGAIAPKLEQAEIERSKRKPTEILDAYDYYLRGMAALRQWTRESNEQALVWFTKAVEADYTFASAYGMAARCMAQRKANGWMVNRESEIAETARLVRWAAEYGREDAVALSSAAFALGYVVGDIENCDAMIDKALELNPNLAWAWYFGAWVKVWLGQPEAAIERVTRALRLNPHDPHAFNMHAAMAHAYFLAGRYAEAISCAETALRDRSDHPSALRALAASAAMIGRKEQAERALSRVRELDPALRVSNLDWVFPFRQPEHFARFADGLRKAGLPE
jgi:TolB-like protein